MHRMPVPAAFHLLVKPAGAACNLDCKYCFFLSKEALYPGSRFRMSGVLLETVVRQLLEAQRHLPEVQLAWQGGEPALMGLDFFRRAVTLAGAYKQPRQRLSHAIQTNGTLLDDAWAAFFKEHGFLVGLSVDGPRESHDTYRVDKGGAGSFDRAMRGWQMLRKHEVDTNILCTVHAANQSRPLEVYRFFRDELGARFIQFIPIVEWATTALLPLANEGWSERPGGGRPFYSQTGSLVTERSVQAEQYGRFLCTIFDEWVQRDVGKVFVQIFDTTLGAHLGHYSLCVYAPTCGNALALEHNGDLYSCDHYVEPDYLLGNIGKTPLGDLVVSDKQRQFGLDKARALPRYCRDCEVRFACNGGCPRNRFMRTADGEEGLNYLCPGYRLFFTHVDRPVKMMASLLRQGRYAEEIMALYTPETAEHGPESVGRNEPCPCGSGKKYKQCHGRPGSPAA